MKATREPTIRFPEIKQQCASCPFLRGNERAWAQVVRKTAAAMRANLLRLDPLGVRMVVPRPETARENTIASIERHAGSFACHSTAMDLRGSVATLKPGVRDELHGAAPADHLRQCPGATQFYRHGTRNGAR